MKQKACHRLIYKLHTKQLKKANWNLTLDLNTALRDYPECVVALNDSQVMRWIDEINGVENVSDAVNGLMRKIRSDKKLPRGREVTFRIKEYYSRMYSLQFQRDYICVIMDSNSDYDRANKGFKVNGIEYRRFLGTNGGIKNSIIVYVNAQIYPELKRRLDNGRAMDVPLVPAKLEAYQALVCSGSTPLPPPRNIIVVKDCITHFKESVIQITDEADGEPVLSHLDNFDIEHNDSDGYGLMTPNYSRRVNEYLSGDGEHEISGMNSRYSWTKGMLYTFDFVDFAEKVAGTYEIVDAWGDKRDVRDADIILTVSMLKLWDLYKSWEDYYENCEKNHYQFSVAKTTPDELEPVRTTNYQFLQNYVISDDDLNELCEPTVNEIKDVLGLDYRKTLAYLLGCGMNERKAAAVEDNYIKALMIEPAMINDPYVRKSVYSMIKKQIECAKKGTIRVDANYAMISGDPYALCQSMFGLEVTGLLRAGEVYHKYWIDKGADEIVCFRAPMSVANNIRRMKLCKSSDAEYWYQYIKTALIYNAWDSACEAMNGADKDGDTNMCTDNPVLVKNTINQPTIICVQRKAEKKIVSEEDIITANKLAFNDDIGVVTNHVTAMIERQAGYSKSSKEYDVLQYRIMCGQLLQQNTIDRAKGIIAKSMPESWYSFSANRIKDDDSEAEKERKLFYQEIVASHKPYFMTYVYPAFMNQVAQYESCNDEDAMRKFFDLDVHTVEELKTFRGQSEEIDAFLDFYEDQKPYGDNLCVINRICRYYDAAFPSYAKMFGDNPPFDYSILKSDRQYSKTNYSLISGLFAKYKREYDVEMRDYKQRVSSGDVGTEYDYNHDEFISRFRREASELCTNKYELCDIVVDMCYTREGTKRFAWEIAGDVIVENLLAKNDNRISYPERGGDEFTFNGQRFTMRSLILEETENDNIE